MDVADLFLCCRSGNLERLRYLVEEKDVDLEVRDKWGGTPLYYACLCGHNDVVHYLLQKGVRCDTRTFDGERCYYAALNKKIKHFLRNYKIIQYVKKNDYYMNSLLKCLENHDYSDIHFVVENEKVFAHRAVLASRNSYFLNHFNNDWKNRTSVDLSELQIPLPRFKKLIEYLYSGTIFLKIPEFNEYVPISELLCITSLKSALESPLTDLGRKERKKEKENFYTRDFQLMLYPRPEQDFRRLFYTTLPRELLVEEQYNELPIKFMFEAFVRENPEPRAIFPDLYIKVQNLTFFCHKIFICARCSYLKALVTDHFSEASVTENNIQVIALHDIEPHIFVPILEFIYCDSAMLGPENVLDVLCMADVFLLPELKKLCASVVKDNLTIENIMPVIKIARLYNLSGLENRCSEFIARNLEEVIDIPELQFFILEDADKIKNREEVDTIAIIDDIRYHIDRSEQVLNCPQKHLLINKLLEKFHLNA